jgi:hypothetical protein
MRARASFALVAVTLASLLAAGCGGGKAAAPGAARCDAHVGASSNANGVLWAQSGGKPAVYAVLGGKVVAPSGVSRVPAKSTGVGFWACRPYSLLYQSGNVLRMSGPHGPTEIGTNGLAAPNGWLLTHHGSTIRYTNGEKVVARGIRTGWQVTKVAVDPKDPHIVFATAVSPTLGDEQCGKASAVVYRVAPSTTSSVLSYDPCVIDPLIGWSPDGTHMSYVAGPQHLLYIADAYGRAAVSLADEVNTYVWSPDGSKIAYDVYNSHTPRVAIVDVATGADRVIAAGNVGAWSPDGKDVAVMSGSKLVAVPAEGGRPQMIASPS